MPKSGSKDGPKGGVDAVVEMLQFMDAVSLRRLLADVGEKDPKLLSEIQQKMFTFEDLLRLSSKELQILLKKVPPARLALALRRGTDALKDHFFMSLSTRAADLLRNEISTLGPRRVSDIEAAQSEILRTAKELETQGKLLLQNRSSSK